MISLAKKDLVELIIKSIDQIIEADEANVSNLSEATELVGEGTVIDSIALIELVTILEESIEKDFSVEVSLFDDEVFEENGPFRNIGSLGDHLVKLLGVEEK
jgi:acyl carrier protein